MNFTDPLVTHAVALLTGIIPLVIYLLASQKKILGYSVLTNAPIITINQADIAGRIVISLDGKSVSGLRSIQILLQNIGTKDIEDQDVYLNFPAPAEIIDSQYEFDPPIIVESPHLVAVDKNRLRLKLELMNPGDKVTVSLLTINNEMGRYSLTAKGPNTKVKKFDHKLFISPVINRSVTAVCVLLFIALSLAYFRSETFATFDLNNKIAAIFVAVIIFIGAARSASARNPTTPNP